MDRLDRMLALGESVLAVMAADERAQATYASLREHLKGKGDLTGQALLDELQTAAALQRDLTLEAVTREHAALRHRLATLLTP